MMGIAEDKIRILLVEDDEELSTITTMRLERQGYRIVAAFDGEQAINKLLTEKIDLILLDVLLPDMDGHEICRKMRSSEIGYTGPIIFMSCMGDSINIVDAFREGGNDYIVKPAKLEVLLERIEANLVDRKETEEEEKRLWFKQFMIDTRTRSVYRVREHVQQEKIELSRTEYDILMVFVTKPEEILLYRQLYKAVWGMEDVGDVRTLMVHVSNLRKKIDEEHGEMIRAIRGVGYLFQDK
ncbi:MAG: response regulator transcription factor [Lachnospiraceae bacterium]|nr:response regulator transcription factor [Lachnospiraceae bacterium]